MRIVRVSLSFLRPIVENVLLFNGKYVLPKSADEVLDTELCDELLMVATPDLERYRKGWKKCWNVWFVIRRIGKDFFEMQQQYVTIQDIGLFFESRQIIDTDTGKRYPTKIAFNNLKDVDLPDEVKDRERIREFLVMKKFYEEQRSPK